MAGKNNPKKLRKDEEAREIIPRGMPMIERLSKETQRDFISGLLLLVNKHFKETRKTD